MQQLLDPLWGRGARNHMKAGYLGDLGSGAIDALLRGWEAKPSPMSELHVHHMGGAAARVATRQLAPSRTATRRTSPTSSRAGPTPRPTTSRSSGAVTSTRRSPSTRPAAPTSTSSQTRGRTASARPTATSAYGRLQALKRNYDPDNAFHRNQNVVPA